MGRPAEEEEALRRRYLELLDTSREQRRALERTQAEIKRLEDTLGLAQLQRQSGESGEVELEAVPEETMAEIRWFEALNGDLPEEGPDDDLDEVGEPAAKRARNDAYIAEA